MNPRYPIVAASNTDAVNTVYKMKLFRIFITRQKAGKSGIEDCR